MTKSDSIYKQCEQESILYVFEFVKCLIHLAMMGSITILLLLQKRGTKLKSQTRMKQT